MRDRQEKTVPRPRKEPRYDGPLTMEGLERIFSDCVDFTRRPVVLEGDRKSVV